MSASEPPSFDPVRWFNHQPYLLLSLAALFWAGNIVLGRYVAGHVPPMTLSCIRWIGVLPDAAAIRLAAFESGIGRCCAGIFR